VAELVDVPDLGSGALRRGGSSPFVRTLESAFFYRLGKNNCILFIFKKLKSIMQITNENKGDGNAIIKVVIEQIDYEKNVADKLKEYRQKASLPGFRPGKVPASLIQKRFAKPILAEEVNSLLTKNLTGYLVDQKISILGDPLPDYELQKKIDWDQDTDFEFVFDIAVSPEIHVNFGQMMAFDYYKIKVDDQMISESVDSVLMRFGTNEEEEAVGEKSSVRGDFAQLDETGEIPEGGIAPKGVLLAVDLMKDESTRNQFIGKKVGDTLVFDPVKAYEDRHEVSHLLNISHEAAEELNSNFSFTVSQILNFRKAELNEELYKKIYGEETGIVTEEQFKERVSEEIALNLAHSSDQKFESDTRKNLIEAISFNLPEDFLKRWLKETNNELTDEQLEKDFPGFSNDLRWQLIKNSIIKEHDLKVEEEEINLFARQIAVSQFQQYGIFEIQEDQLNNYVKKLLEKEEDKERIIRRLYDGKVFQLIRQEASIVLKEVSSSEFRAIVNNNTPMEE
jgi:trigger factor